MLKLAYQSDPIQYRIAVDPSLGSAAGDYNQWLLAPPRSYGESVSNINGLFPSPITTAKSENCIAVMTTNAITQWPSYTWVLNLLDAYTGKFAGRSSASVYGLNMSAYAMRDGSLWTKDLYGALREVDPVTQNFVSAAPLFAERFGLLELSCPLVDKQLDRMILSDGLRQLRVYRFSDAAFLGSMLMTDNIRSIFPADERRAYVRLNQNEFILIDYIDFRVMGIVKVPNVTNSTVVSWDWRRRRFLACDLTADAADGACTISVRGYYPVPQATSLTKPIPLKALRKDRTVPFWVRTVGDVGEGIAGRPVSVTATGGTLVSGLVQTGNDGSAVFNVQCGDPGSMTINCSVEVL